MASEMPMKFVVYLGEDSKWFWELRMDDESVVTRSVPYPDRASVIRAVAEVRAAAGLGTGAKCSG
jgi:uncharacterized protein YegP (UPF0339 family)